MHIGVTRSIHSRVRRLSLPNRLRRSPTLPRKAKPLAGVVEAQGPERSTFACVHAQHSTPEAVRSL